MCWRGGEGPRHRCFRRLPEQGGGAGHRTLGHGAQPAAAGQPSGCEGTRYTILPAPIMFLTLCFSSVGLALSSVLLLNVMQGSFPAKYFYLNTSRDSPCLDNNYQAFLLVDDGSVGRRGGETGFRAKLEDYISHQRTGIWGEERAATVSSNIGSDRFSVGI